jgi:predicted AAA+ superfamily ATPase
VLAAVLDGRLSSVVPLGACPRDVLARAALALIHVEADRTADGDEARLDAERDSLAGGRALLILDEAQHAPWVFSRLRGAIDADRKRNGRFLILGSVSPVLMEGVAESLAGRLAIVRMSPFLVPELQVSRLDDLWLCGGYPDGGVLDPRMFPVWQQDHLDTLATRDLPAWGLAARPPQTRRLMAMLAVMHGQTLNASQLGASLALDHETVLSHCDYLEGAFLIRRLIRHLPPFLPSTRKRLVKRPRVSWRDSGLLHALLGVRSLHRLYHQPAPGASREGFVIEQTLATLGAKGRSVEPCFVRTSDGHELDLVLDLGDERWAIEVKLTSSPSRGELSHLRSVAGLAGARRSVMVGRIGRRIESDDLLVASRPAWLRALA